MPARSKAQFRFMQWLAHGGQKKGAPSASVAKEFVEATPSYKALPEKKKEKRT